MSVSAGDRVSVVAGRLKGEGGIVTGVTDTHVIFESDMDGRRRTCQRDRVSVDEESA